MTNVTDFKGKAASSKKRASLSNVGGPGDPPGAWPPVSGITPDNYTAFAKECFGLRGDAYLVALNNGKWGGAEFKYSAKQWGAWLAFFERAKIPHAFMKQRGESELFYQVPTEWPHQFTTDSTIMQDHDAGSAFERKHLERKGREREEWARRAETVERRTAQAMKAKASMRSEPRMPTPAEHLKVSPEIEAPGLDKDALFRSHDEAMAQEGPGGHR